MRHYYSIANFLAGIGVKTYDYCFSSYGNQTYQQLLGQMLGWSQGRALEVQAMFNNNVLPQHFVNQWGNNLTRTIVKQFNHQYIEYNNGNIKGWNGDAAAIIQHTSLWNVVSEWNNVATIVADVSDVIYQSIRDATSKVGVDFSKFPSWQIKELVKELGIESLKSLKEVGVDFSKLGNWEIKELVNKYGIESLKPLKEVGADFSKLQDYKIMYLVKELGITTLVKELGIENLKPLKEVGVDFSKLSGNDTRNLVKELGIENLKSLKEVGVDFSKLDCYAIKELVNKYGLESLKPLKEVGADFSKLDRFDIKKLVSEWGIDIEITEFYKIIDDMTISHDIIEHHIDYSKVEQDTISAIEEVAVNNNLDGIVIEPEMCALHEDL